VAGRRGFVTTLTLATITFTRRLRFGNPSTISGSLHPIPPEKIRSSVAMQPRTVNRDGFGARDFHGHCDWHANTVPLIEDTGGNIFQGFTSAM
jgi:hypothetical protein